MAEQVADGVWWFHGTKGCNVYLVDCGGELIVVDPGFKENTRPVIRELEETAPGRTLSRIFLTHAHRDHAGAAGRLRRLTGATVLAGEGDTRPTESGQPVLSDGTAGGGPTERVGRVIGRLRGRPATIPVDEVVDRRTEVAAGTVAIPVPGHTPGSLAFILEDRDLAIVGDLVISHRDCLSRPMKMANSNDEQYLETLARFAASAPASGLAGHGRPVIDTFGDELRELAGFPRRHLLSPGLIRDRARRFWNFGSWISNTRQSED
ncbi:MAG TPA: MBL fold metallo-hydrolase [Dehalococcoidia bacterium]|nr:MBL fold metallo-hydrolase [Dehalococcoidia bacterium]